MKSPKEKKELTKDGKPKASSSSVKSGAEATPGFAVAKCTQNADGTWLAVMDCINGDPKRSTKSTLPKGITYFGGKEAIKSPADVAVFLPDGKKIDTKFLFPWMAEQPDPMRLGGGKIKGDILEGAQRANVDPKSPIMAPFVVTELVNGTALKLSIMPTDTFGLVFFPGDVVFGLAIKDNATDKLVIKAMAKREGPCLDSVKV
jgi:hypothetical protein